uniref:AraC family transcriptional regulator n=1 Tax=Panagrellus redivivus TaxID=6233 RepID=A0A7E4ZUR2_PANRE
MTSLHNQSRSTFGATIPSTPTNRRDHFWASLLNDLLAGPETALHADRTCRFDLRRDDGNVDIWRGFSQAL